MVWRVLTGIGASGVIPLTFALIGDLFPFNQRGAKLGLVFAPMEGDGCWVSRGGHSLSLLSVGKRCLLVPQL